MAVSDLNVVNWPLKQTRYRSGRVTAYNNSLLTAVPLDWFVIKVHQSKCARKITRLTSYKFQLPWLANRHTHNFTISSTNTAATDTDYQTTHSQHANQSIVLRTCVRARLPDIIFHFSLGVSIRPRFAWPHQHRSITHLYTLWQVRKHCIALRYGTRSPGISVFAHALIITDNNQYTRDQLAPEQHRRKGT